MKEKNPLGTPNGYFPRTVKESHGSNLRNYELIKLIYDRCPKWPNGPYTIDQYYDRCQDIVDMIERERPELKGEPDQKLKDYQDRQQFFNDTEGY
jgi:hypothetical protein